MRVRLADHFDSRLLGVAGVLDGVALEVLPSLPQHAWVSLDGRQIGDVPLDVTIPPFGHEELADLFDQTVHVHPNIKRRRPAHLRVA